MDVRTKERRSANTPGTRQQWARMLDKGENTDRAADKKMLDQFQEIQNLVHDGLDWKLRGGQSILADIENIVTIGKWEKEDGNSLVAQVKTADDVSKIVEVDRTDGSTTDLITGIASEQPFYFASLRNILYSCNGETDVQIWDGSSATTLATSSGFATNIATDGERIWATLTTGQLIFSDKQEDGAITTFTATGTTLNRAGVANSYITKFTCLIGAERSVIVCDSNKTESHETPAFAQSGITTFPADMETLVKRWSFVGTKSAGGAIHIGGRVYIKGENDRLYAILENTQLKEIKQARGLMAKMDWDTVQMSYDQRWNLLLISGKKDADSNDTVIAYNVNDNVFSRFTRHQAGKWVSDENNTYYIRTYDRKIIDCLSEESWKDFGDDIDWKIRTSDTYGESGEFKKVLLFLFLNFLAYEDTVATLSVIDEQKIGGSKNATWSSQIGVVNDASPYSGLPYFTQGIWGGAGFSREDRYQEYYNSDIMVNVEFFRASLELTGSSGANFVFRGIGLSFKQTSKKQRQSNFTS